MRKINTLRLITGPALAAALIVPFAGGCSSKDNPLESLDSGLGCAADLEAKATAFTASVDALVTAAGDMKAQLAVACFNIAHDLGDTTVTDPGDGSTISDDAMQTLCTAASAKINAEITASGQITASFTPAQCTVAAQAQIDCEASCSADASCEGGSIEARCTPAELSGQCSGECTGSLECSGTATAAASCQGTCSATCTGTCAGNCDGTCSGTCAAQDSTGKCQGSCTGTCTGHCDASCDGTCSGTCRLDANATVTCNGQASCRGGCSVAYTAPKCDAALTPPTCNVDAQCKGGCDGQAKFEADCTPPAVVITGTANAAFATTLQTNLPAILAVVAKVQLIGTAAATVATDATAVGQALTDSVACAATLGVSFAANVQASVQASASVSVSVQASADVSGSAGAG